METRPNNQPANQLQNTSTILPQGAAGSTAKTCVKREDNLDKVMLRRLKNREAAKKFRMNKKMYWQDMEAQTSFLEYENEQLKQEVLYWKQLYRSTLQQQA